MLDGAKLRCDGLLGGTQGGKAQNVKEVSWDRFCDMI